MNRHEPLTCAEVTHCLLAGAGSTEPRLARHLHSCLPCYRIAIDLRTNPALSTNLEELIPDPGPEFWQQLPERIMAQIPLGLEPKQQKPRWVSIALPTITLGAVTLALLYMGPLMHKDTDTSAIPPVTTRLEIPLTLETEISTPSLGDLLDSLDKVTLHQVAGSFDAEYAKTFLGDWSTTDSVEEIESLDESGLRAVAHSMGFKENI